MRAYVRLIVVFSLTALLSVAIYYGAESGWGRLAPVRVTLANDSDQAQLFERIQASLATPLSRLQGEWLWKVSLPQVLELVEKDRRVKEVRIKREFPNRLEVIVTPHRPVAAWVDKSGRFFPLAADGSLLPALTLKDSLDLPLLRGNNFREQIELREKALALLQEWPANGIVGRDRVSEMSYSNKWGFALLISGGAEVRVGEGEYGPKASRVERVLTYLQEQQLRGRVIDARFAKKVVVRLRNAP